MTNNLKYKLLSALDFTENVYTYAVCKTYVHQHVPHRKDETIIYDNL